MNLLLDLETMSVMLPGGVPVSDLNLVRGDKVPLRITVLDGGVAVAPEGVKPALAVKVDAASEQLVLAATDMEVVGGEYGVCYAGELSVNTVQLADVMGGAERMDFEGEVVLIDAEGGQRSSGLIRVRVRRDLLGDDVVPPVEVVRDWGSMAEDALKGPLEKAVARVREAGTEGVLMANLAEQYAVQAYNSAQRATSSDAHAMECAQRAEAAAGEAKDASEVANAAVAALEAMPEIDTSGNMTLAGGLTAGGAINANGGINKPLTVLPTTAQSVLNRSDAFGAYCVQLAHSAPALITSVTSAGLTVKTEVPGQLHRFTARSQTEPKSGKITTTHELLSRGNYCRTKGFTIPLRARIYEAGCAAKITFGIGRFNNVTEKVDADLDSFRFSPTAGTAWDQFTEEMQRIIDVTFYYDDVENSNDVYKIRVRELRYINNLGKWVVNETITRISSFNTSISDVHNLTFHMNGKVASLWAVVNGYWSVSTVWLADLTPPSDLFDTNLLSTNLYVDLLGSTFLIGNPILFIPPGNGQQNGAYNAFKSIEYRNLISETTYDFTPYELEES